MSVESPKRSTRARHARSTSASMSVGSVRRPSSRACARVMSGGMWARSVGRAPDASDALRRGRRRFCLRAGTVGALGEALARPIVEQVAQLVVADAVGARERRAEVQAPLAAGQLRRLHLAQRLEP